QSTDREFIPQSPSLAMTTSSYAARPPTPTATDDRNFESNGLCSQWRVSSQLLSSKQQFPGHLPQMAVTDVDAIMWVEIRRACELVQNFEERESITECAELIREVEKFKWRIQNILKNPGKSSIERVKLKADAEVAIDGVKVSLDQALCDETTIISDIFNLNEMDALELVLSGESQRIHFDCLNRGLIAVVCYYDVHRLLAVLLRTMLDWDKETMHETLRMFIEQNFVQRTMFQHLLQLQASFSVATEFHMLSQPHVNGLGGAKHQTLLRNVIEEIRENAAEALYSLCEWGAEHAFEFLLDVYPILKGVPLAEKFLAHHLSAWICMVKLTSQNVLSQTNTAATVLSNFVKEIRNETVWSDQSVCGTAQLTCAIALRSLAVSPADHLKRSNFRFTSRSDYFKQCCTHVRVVDGLLKQLIALFPAKATPALHYENILRCISDLYQIVDDPKASENVKSYITELSIAFSSSGSMELCRFIERARLPHHVVHAVAYLDLLCSVCRTRQVAAFIFDVFARVPAHDDGFMGWDHVMSALRSYERLFRERSGGTSMFGHTLSQQQPKAVIPPRELIGMIAWINLARIVISLDEDAAEVFLEERQWAVLDAALGVVSAPVPLPLKGALLRLVAALARREASAHRIWTALAAHQLCTFAENGALLGLQKELDERECTEEMFDTSLGFVNVLRSLLSHKHIPIPEIAAPYLQYLTKSIVSQMASRSYKDIEQFYELEEVSLSALLYVLKQSYVDTRAVIRREPHVALLIQILNDTAVYRAICAVLLEDVSVQEIVSTVTRRTSPPALPAIQLISTAVSRHAVLRASIRGTDSDIMLAPLQTLLLTPLQPSGVSILDIVLLYIEQSQMVELLRARKSVARYARAIRSVLNPSTIRYTISDMVAPARGSRAYGFGYRVAAFQFLGSATIHFLEFDDNDPVRMRGEAALVVLEALSDSVETDPAGNNLCFLLFGFKPYNDSSGQLYGVESQPTGFHQVLSVLEQFVGAQDPLQLHFSSLIEPSFRLLDAADGPTHLSVTRMISGSILHLSALEVSSLLKSGHFTVPHHMYSTLLESSDTVVNSDEALEGVDNLLFSLLRHGHIELTGEIEYPRLVHFNAHKLQALFDTCKTTTVFNIAQYDMEYLHELLTREIVSTQAEDTSVVTREMEAVLTYGTDVNAQLLQRGASEQLVSGCTALLNVMALFAPVPFFSIESQLEMLTDAAFLLVEYVSGCGAEEQVAVCATLLRLCKSICNLSKQEYTEVPSSCFDIDSSIFIYLFTMIFHFCFYLLPPAPLFPNIDYLVYNRLCDYIYSVCKHYQLT
ncbi:hypothetical protein GCK32_004050, partial [Trichostrongylus colubriformis]